MSLSNVEFFDKALNYVHHDEIDFPDIDDDYIACSTTSIEIGKTTKISKDNLVVINGDWRYIGMVSAISELEDNYEKGTITVAIKPFIMLFSSNIIFDTSKQNVSSGDSLETTIGNYIKSNWVNHSDPYQNFTSLDVQIKTSTMNWNLGIESGDSSKVTVVNMYSSIIAKAMSKYGIAITPRIDHANKKLILDIGTNSNTFYLEADLETVILQTFKVHDYESATNRMDYVDASNNSNVIRYYLHPDGTYDTTNENRITPVIFDIEILSASSGKTFAQTAEESAKNKFKGLEWKDCIEIVVNTDDTLVNPMDLKFGQVVKIVHNDSIYESILTGRKISEGYVILTFGTMREEYTKQQLLNGRE